MIGDFSSSIELQRRNLYHTADENNILDILLIIEDAFAVSGATVGAIAAWRDRLRLKS